MIKKIITLILTLLAACLLFAACAQPASTNVPITVVPAGEDSKTLSLQNTINVSGYGEIKVKPDIAYISLGVSSTNTKLKTAQDDNRNKMNALYTLLKNNSVNEKDIQTSSYNVNPIYDYNSSTRRITGYSVTNILQ